MYTIGELAKAAGVPLSTVRFYERRGLLSPQGRTESNYRTYTSESLEALQFIMASKRVGFTLRDISRLLGLRDGSEDCCGDVRSVIAIRVADLREKIRELQHAEVVLGKALEWCEQQGGEGRCPVLDDLAKPSA